MISIKMDPRSLVALGIELLLALPLLGNSSQPKAAYAPAAFLHEGPANGLTADTPAPTLACLASLNYGDTIQCSIDSIAETDVITFEGTAGERVRIRVVETSGTLFAYQELQRPGGTTLCGPSSGTDLTCLLDATGTYSILVRDNNNTDTGGYSLHLQRLSDPVGCASLSLGATPVSAVVALPAEYDCFTFDGALNDRVRIRVVETSGTLFAYQEVLRPDGTALCGPSSGTDLTCLLDASGAHTVLVGDNDGRDTGGYRLSIQRLTQPLGCLAVSFGAAPISSTIDYAAEYDCFTFDGVLNDRVRIRTVETSGTLFAYQEILRPDGNPLCGPSSGMDLTCLLDVSGAHTVLVSDNDGRDTGGYRLFIQRLNNPVGCTSLAYGAASITGFIDLAAEFDCFTFSGAADNTVQISVVETSGTLFVYQEVLRPDGNTICGPSSVADLSCLLDSTGTHTALVGDNDGKDAGGYQISLTCLSGNCGGPSPTPTPKPPPGDWRVYLPVLGRGSITYFEGPWEQEDNDSSAQANGPLRSGKDYFGYPDDFRDYFSIYMPEAGQISVDLTNHPGEGVQLQLFHQSVENRVCFDPFAPYRCEYAGQPGWYYIFIFTESGFSTSTPYTLRVSYP